jgi:hypothetical protein
MSDIFISYEKSDLPRAEMLARSLRGHGWTTFWDRTIPAGSTWRKTIGLELDGARCVVVLWSRASKESRWVHEEAEDALVRGILMPVLIENIQPPIGFRSIQAGNLANWDGTAAAPGFQKLLSDITGLIGPGRSLKEEHAPRTPEPPPKPPNALQADLGEEVELFPQARVQPAASHKKAPPSLVRSVEAGSRHFLLLLGNSFTAGVLGALFAATYFGLGLWQAAAIMVAIVALLTAIQSAHDNSKGLARFFLETDLEWIISHAILFVPIWCYTLWSRAFPLDGLLMFSLIYLSANYCSNYVARAKLPAEN